MEKKEKKSRIEPIVKFGTDVPRGFVMMWHGRRQDLPKSWHVCDGQEGTPDLTTLSAQLGVTLVKRVK